MTILHLMWIGFWQGVGETAGFFALFLLWLLFYHNHGHKFDAEHFVHTVHDYFTK